MLFLAVTHEILYLVQKHGNLVSAHARNVLSFSITNEVGFGKYLSCENRWEKTSLMRKLVAMHAHWMLPS